MNDLGSPARAYVAVVIAAGAVTALGCIPASLPSPWLLLFLVGAVFLTSAWKVNLPISLASGSTLSVSYAANLMALLLAGPRTAVFIAAVGVWTQCVVHAKRRYPAYRTVFSIAAEVLTMAATGLVYRALGGDQGPFVIATLVRPLVAAIATYFVLNTGLVAIAIGLTTDRSPTRVWREEFLWSAASFMVAGSAGALAAVVIQRGQEWQALLLLAPVYLTYRTYHVFIDRIEAERRHHSRLIDALDQMEAAKAAAESANRLKDQFLATVSHELRTPLHAILGWADMLRSGVLPEERRQQAYTAIFNNAQRQGHLVEGLLDTARITTGHLSLEHAPIHPKDIIAAAVETVQPAADAKKIAIEVDMAPDVCAIVGDGARLQQVLWNLLSNAVKFTPSGGAIVVRARRGHDAAEFVVQDSGEGIPPSFLPAVFEPFRQADESSTRTNRGLGLGLAISRQLVEAHGGTIAAASQGEGRGATFTVRVPLVPSGTRLAS